MLGSYDLTWGMPVIGYLFLAGLGAGALTVSASMLLRGGLHGEYFQTARMGSFIALPTVGIGTALLVFELGSFEAGHWFRWINLYRVINLSPMSIGSWLLAVFLIVGLVYAYTFISKNAAPGDSLDGLRRKMAWISVPLGVGVAIYTGVLLGAMPSRPFWNSPILAMLFLISALSSGIAILMLARVIMNRKTSDPAVKKSIHECSYILASSDTLLLGLELLMIFLFIMYAHLTVGGVANAIKVILFDGTLAAQFWVGVVIIGLVIPAMVELYLVVPRLLYKRDYIESPVMDIIIPITVLFGGLMLRYVIVIAGQITYPVGL